MASLYIKDEDTAALVGRVAMRSGMTKTALVRELAAAREAELDRRDHSRLSTYELLEKIWRDHPLGEPTGLVADKAFYDSLNDEEDD
ncbi:type II toxin-antitoxin system VapB family antitoxin [uncultured Sphingomonas sp.]|uniref:type II toxin-antitoxin system VapB family antitoxin n=1 Tax=uncultured Sphingomonas sp. TaxID=158754 RepID=UPI0035CC61A8